MQTAESDREQKLTDIWLLMSDSIYVHKFFYHAGKFSSIQKQTDNLQQKLQHSVHKQHHLGWTALIRQQPENIKVGKKDQQKS